MGAAREMGRLPLEQALQLLVLYVEQDDPRAERAMVKWLGRERAASAVLALAQPRGRQTAHPERGDLGA